MRIWIFENGSLPSAPAFVMAPGHHTVQVIHQGSLAKPCPQLQGFRFMAKPKGWNTTHGFRLKMWDKSG